MEHLRSGDQKCLCDFLDDLYGLRDHSAFIDHVLAVLPQVTGCDRISYNNMNLETRQAVFRWSPRSNLMEELRPVFVQYMHQHPTAPYVAYRKWLCREEFRQRLLSHIPKNRSLQRILTAASNKSPDCSDNRDFA